ncbi:MAG: GAF domain-containing protein [Cyanobacteria bacterium P01_G01_bin.67]
MRERERWQGIVKAKHRNGHLFDEELALTFSATGDLICVCQDISDRLKADTKLRMQKTQLSKLNRNLEAKVAQRTKVLATFSDRLKQLHHLAISDYETLEDLYTAYLKTGCEIFGLSTGIISQVTEDIYKVLAVRSSLAISVGLEMNCGDTYRSEVVEKHQTVTYFDVRQLAEMQNHPTYLRFDLKSFIGTPILVNGRLYGTLNFSDVSRRDFDFNSSEQEIIELMARDIGNSISAFQSEIGV